ncbi:hypothetical protein CBU03nite_17900 [Clostridium butyricum]|uniref:Uncharacterized protein n=2 Tax=Clostridium butyricum TaxID=1492 RepID=C4IIR0_CLOBU|nr:hypothetical protein CBY_3208 [Clostridium butyricum 5521]EEP53340.1 hypothetical protein CLP_2296 [Clostridium butyricum E4 str. BoNT E BL5262]BBK77154.1 hypothetical protein Cbu04g_21620 [Clostridium butyricum]GEQ21541.1 hypothetical protein CBU02nite_20470 [Clostridium butyricum]GEQ25367.1 hypothetical protein CBU03nite_17900 [Clostridium butyricum]
MLLYICIYEISNMDNNILLYEIKDKTVLEILSKRKMLQSM